MGSDERPPPKVRGRRWRPRMRLAFIALVLVACGMITSVVLYINGSASQHIPVHGAPTSGGTTVTLDVVSISSNYSELVGNLIIRPGPALVDPVTDALKHDLTVAVTSATTPVRRTYSSSWRPHKRRHNCHAGCGKHLKQLQRARRRPHH